MEAGFEVVGEDFSILINASWINYDLQYTETQVSQSTNIGSMGFYGVVFHIDNPSALAFVHCESEFTVIVAGWLRGSRVLGVSTRVSGIAVKLYAFRQQAPTGSRAGLQLFNELGALVFDGASKFARIAGSIPGSAVETAGKTNLTPSRQYAVLMPSFTGAYLQISRPGSATPGMRWTTVTTWRGPTFKCESDGIRTGGWKLYSSIDEPSPTEVGRTSYSYPSSEVIIADVTGY